MSTTASATLIVPALGLMVPALGLFIPKIRALLKQMALGKRLERWATSLARARSDAQMWRLAQNDARLMADLKAAISRGAK